MADIDVVRKPPTVWPWILGLIVMALLIWELAEALDPGGADAPAAEQPAPAEGDPAPR